MLKKVLKMLLKRRKRHRARKLVQRNLLHLPLAHHPVPKIKVFNGHLRFSVTVHSEEVNRLKVVTRIRHS